MRAIVRPRSGSGPFGLAAAIGVFAVAHASLAAEPVTAIDVLLLPDQTMIEHAGAAIHAYR